MEKIKMLCEMIDEELEVSKKYACEAVKFKSSDSALASTLYEISTQEVTHVNRLHSEIVRLIEAYKKEHGDPPEAMRAVYDFLHEKQILRLNKIKVLQGQYKGQ